MCVVTMKDSWLRAIAKQVYSFSDSKGKIYLYISPNFRPKLGQIVLDLAAKKNRGIKQKREINHVFYYIFFFSQRGNWNCKPLLINL